MQFKWNESKAARNLSKHGVSFEEAKTVFDDPLYVDFYDPDHSEDEERYLIVGESNQGRVLIVSYTERGNSIGASRFCIPLPKSLSQTGRGTLNPAPLLPF
ncbi:BrnT family toxin [bacterium]|nr:BrnT family toxin [bacterium]